MAGKGFTVKKDWDNPREHAMPEEARVPRRCAIGPVVVTARYGAGAHGRGNRHRVPPLYPPCQPVYADDQAIREPAGKSRRIEEAESPISSPAAGC